MKQTNPNLSIPKIQSLTPTTLTGSVLPPAARTASVAIPTPAPPQPLSSAPGSPGPVEVGEPADAAPVLIGKPPRRNPFVEYWRKVGGGSLTLSLLVHAGLIAGFVAIVTVTVHEPKVDFLPGGGSTQGATASQELAHQVQQKKRTALNKSTPLSRVVSTGMNAALTLPDVPVDALDVPDLAIPMASSGGLASSLAGGGFGVGRGIGGQAGMTFTSLPPSMKSRCSAPERLQKLKESGGRPECEKAVSAALEYLRTKQNADGSWGDNYRAGMTGFALLCYFGRCETPDSVFYGENVMKGILYLIELSKKNGGMMSTAKSNGAVYEHGIATYALGEMYALARLGSKSLPGMREAFENGVKLIIKNQLPTGGWGYDREGNYRDSGASDPSVTGWHYQALKAAKLSGLNFSGLYPAIDRAMKYLASIQTKDGGFGGANREAGAYTQWTMTGVAVLGLQTLGHGEQLKIKKGIKWAYDFYQTEKPEWKEANFYVWYYIAQIFFQNGGAEWKFWNETALPEILAHQEKDGRWRSPTNYHGATFGGNDIYPTALCTLMLEVYYRYLKVGDREEGSVFDRGR
jgi:hypothetical protein